MFNDDEDVRLQTDNYKKYFTKWPVLLLKTLE